MKRVFSLFLALALCLSLCACTVGDNTTPTAESNPTEATNATKFTDATTEPTTEPTTEHIETGTKGLEYFPLSDGTYGVKAGNTLYWSEIVIPAEYDGKAVTQILPNAFESATNLVSITIPNGVINIGDYAFRWCPNLESITIPASVTAINQQAFLYCTKLTSVTIPESVTSIGMYAFDGCTSLTSITYEGTIAQWNNISKDYRWFSNIGAYTICCIDGEISE